MSETAATLVEDLTLVDSGEDNSFDHESAEQKELDEQLEEGFSELQARYGGGTFEVGVSSAFQIKEKHDGTCLMNWGEGWMSVGRDHLDVLRSVGRYVHIEATGKGGTVEVLQPDGEVTPDGTIYTIKSQAYILTERPETTNDEGEAEYLSFAEDTPDTQREAFVAPELETAKRKEITFWEFLVGVEYQSAPITQEAPLLASLFAGFPEQVTTVSDQEVAEVPLSQFLQELTTTEATEIVLAGEPAAVQSPDIPYTDVTIIRKETDGEQTVLSFEFKEVPTATEGQLAANSQWEAVPHTYNADSVTKSAGEVGSPTVIAAPTIISLDTLVKFETQSLRQPALRHSPSTTDQREKLVMHPDQPTAGPLNAEPPHDLPIVFEERLVTRVLPSDIAPENVQTEVELVTENVWEPVAPAVVSVVLRDSIQESTAEDEGVVTVEQQHDLVHIAADQTTAPEQIATMPVMMVEMYGESQPEHTATEKIYEGELPPFSEAVSEAEVETMRVVAAPDVLNVDSDTVQPPVTQAAVVTVTDVVPQIPITIVETRELLTRPEITGNNQAAIPDAARVPLQPQPRSVTTLEETPITSLKPTEFKVRVQEEFMGVSQQRLTSEQSQRSIDERIAVPSVADRVAPAMAGPAVTAEELSIQNAAVLRRPVFDVDEEDETTFSVAPVSSRTAAQRRANAA